MENYKTDIAIVSETLLFARSKITLKGFKTYRCDGPNGLGSVMVVVQQGVPHALLATAWRCTKIITIFIGREKRACGLWPFMSIPIASYQWMPIVAPTPGDR